MDMGLQSQPIRTHYPFHLREISIINPQRTSLRFTLKGENYVPCEQKVTSYTVFGSSTTSSSTGGRDTTPGLCCDDGLFETRISLCCTVETAALSPFPASCDCTLALTPKAPALLFERYTVFTDRIELTPEAVSGDYAIRTPLERAK